MAYLKNTFLNFFDNFSDLLVVMDHAGVIQEANSSCTGLLGYASEEISGKLFCDFIHPDEREHCRSELRKLVRPDTRLEFVTRFQTKSGSFPFLAWTIRSSSEGTALYASGRDVTAERRADDLLKARVRLLEYSGAHSVHQLLQKTLDELGTLMESPIGFFHFIHDDQETIALQAWSTRTLREICTAEGSGMHYPLSRAGVWADCIRERKAVIHNDYSTLPHRKGMPKGHATVSRELVVPIFRDGKIKAIIGVGNKPGPYTEQDVHEVTRFADLVWDIAARKQLELELRNALEARDEFFSIASHELKTPLTALSLQIQLARRKLEQDGHASLLLQQSIQQVRRLTELLNELLDVTRIRAGKLSIERSEVDLRRSATEAVESLQHEAELTGSTLTLSAAEPVIGSWDPNRISQIFNNLLSNALKYGKGGPIEVRVSKSPLCSGAAARIEVQDSGNGIPPELREAIFRRFERGRPGERVSGLGLGLYITRQIVEAHGGRIWVESELNRGANFICELPFETE